ncbi:MAG: hypothetical protein Q4E53_08890 [Eubacteriales bacterium]|nr:hypothetical protein [Eubacteriales bacterium]
MEVTILKYENEVSVEEYIKECVDVDRFLPFCKECGNYGKTVTKYLGQELLWMKEGRLPEYFMLVGGILKK